MDRTQVSSTTITSVGYDAGTMVLEVEFRNGGLYQYFDVPETVHSELMAAASLGAFLNSVVKENYRYARV